MVHRPDLSVFREASVASLDLIKMVQQAPAFGQRLDELRAHWRVSTLIHRDVKWDNFVVVASPSTRRVTGVKLVDWEAAGAGDPRWDIGSVFSHYLSFWVFSIPITGQTPPESFAKLARYPLSRMRSALQSCWAAYVAERGLDSPAAQEVLYGAVQYSGARLVQTAFEITQASMLITSAVVLHLQLAMNILQRPQEAAVHLLGLPGAPDRAR
jgi:aminoglycoside phosphotransferase (APT) family kinase protein